MAEAVREQNGERMLEVVQELERNGQNLQHFCRELARYFRNLLVAKIAGKPTRLIAASDREQQVDDWRRGRFQRRRPDALPAADARSVQNSSVFAAAASASGIGLMKLVQVGKLQSIEEAIARTGQPDHAAARKRACAAH